jgi:hypothetical protein
LEQDEKEDAGEELDADAAERKRARQAEEWRLKQLRSGVSSQQNSNFQVGQLPPPHMALPLSGLPTCPVEQLATVAVLRWFSA